MQGLSKLTGLRRQFAPSRPLEGDKLEQLGDNFFFNDRIVLPWWHLGAHAMINAWLELLF